MNFYLCGGLPKKVMLYWTFYLGHGASLIEARRSGRHGIGVELEPQVADIAKQNIKSEATSNGVSSAVIVADSTTLQTKQKVVNALRNPQKKVSVC